jgi:hypothetical protein
MSLQHMAEGDESGKADAEEKGLGKLPTDSSHPTPETPRTQADITAALEDYWTKLDQLWPDLTERERMVFFFYLGDIRNLQADRGLRKEPFPVCVVSPATAAMLDAYRRGAPQSAQQRKMCETLTANNHVFSIVPDTNESQPAMMARITAHMVGAKQYHVALDRETARTAPLITRVIGTLADMARIAAAPFFSRKDRDPSRTWTSRDTYSTWKEIMKKAEARGITLA